MMRSRLNAPGAIPSHPRFPQPFHRDPLLLGIIGVGIVLAGVSLFIALGLGSGPVLAVLPWINPLFFIFIALTSVSIAILALGRFQVLADPFSYWVGIGFAMTGITMTFYVLTWPNLLPDGRSFIGQLPNTAGFIATLNPTILLLFLLAAVLLPWPTRQTVIRRYWIRSLVFWSALFILAYILIVVYEQRLPLMVRPDGTYAPGLLLWNGIIVFFSSLGAVLALRRYRRSGDRLAAYVVLPQMALIFATLLIMIGGKRYDLGWYLGRVILGGGFLSILFGLLSEHIQLLWSEREIEMRYRQLADAMPQLVWTARPEGTVDYFNQRYQEYTGIAPTSGEVWNWAPVLDPEDVQPTLEAWQRSVETGEVYQVEHRVRMADNSSQWHLSRAVLGRDENGRPTKWFGTTTNIQDLKQAEAALQEHTLRLERANRDLQNLTLAASHDLQEPLRKIEAFGDALVEDAAKLDAQQTERIQRMRKSAQQMRMMVTGLAQLTFLTTETQTFQRVDLNQVVQEVLAGLEGQIHQLDAIIEVSHLPMIEADCGQMRTLLLHLIENALKFQAPGEKPHVKIGFTQPAPDKVLIQVEDNGIGFDEAHAGQLFQPFKRLVGKNQPEYEGYGLGLAICQRIVERHNGTIAAKSEPGKGTAFRITLPSQRRESINHEAQTAAPGC